MLTKHYAVFCSPGSFTSEVSEHEISRWDIHEVIEISKTIKERYNSKPYGFYFVTKGRGPLELNSKIQETSKMYYLGGTVETYEEVCARNDPKEEILRSNMKWNNFDKIIVNTNSYKFTAPLREGDTVLNIVDGILTGETHY